jgi:uncharacterized protein
MLEFSEKQKDMIKTLVEKYSLRFLLLFGSQVTGQTHAKSDYDIAYLSERVLSIREEGGMISDLMPILNVSDERLINLVNFKTASALLKYSITTNCELLFESEETLLARYQAASYKMYLEMMPIYEERERRLRADLLMK